MPLPSALQQLIPLEKSWMIRLGMLDLQAGKTEVQIYLNDHEGELGDDLVALLKVLEQWGSDTPLEVGESGTLYRFVRYLQLLENNTQPIITQGTLKNRHLAESDSLLTLDIEDLLQLDSGTSQWASAAVLFTDAVPKVTTKLPYHLQMSLDAKKAWKAGFEARFDSTLQRQAEAYVTWLQTNEVNFEPIQSEDFPFASAFGLMTTQEGERRWPQLRNHETDRIAEMDSLLSSKTIDSPDHRVVQALSMRFPDRPTTPRAKKAVNKTWPRFWDFLAEANSL